MKNIVNLIGLIFLICYFSSCSLRLNNNLLPQKLAYFGQEPPQLTPKIFAPNFISKKDRYEFGCTLNKKGDEFFFAIDEGEKVNIYFTKVENGAWTEPEKLFKQSELSANDPMLSPDENRLYFISKRSNDQSKNKKDYDIWYSERKGQNWSLPISAGNIINSTKDEYYISFAKNGAMYFSSNKNAEDDKSYNFDIYRSTLKNSTYLEPQKLPTSVNTTRYEADVFVAPDESYLIFCGKRKGGLGKGDLYVSFKDNEGNWSKSKNMGSPINSENHELCPFVSPDGKYFFYTSNQDIYWVSSEIIEKLR